MPVTLLSKEQTQGGPCACGGNSIPEPFPPLRQYPSTSTTNVCLRLPPQLDSTVLQGNTTDFLFPFPQHLGFPGAQWQIICL